MRSMVEGACARPEKKFGDSSLDVFPVRSHFRGLPETDPLLAEVPRMGDFAADFLQKQQTQGRAPPNQACACKNPADAGAGRR